MLVAFRSDASLIIGTGHVMRCLTLAEALTARGVRCRFIGREHPGNLLEMIRQHNFDVHRLPVDLGAVAKDASTDNGRSSYAAWLGSDWATDAAQTRSALGDSGVDWLIVDHYAVDVRWEQSIRPACRNLMVIDDLADRMHDCDLLLDQTLGRDACNYGHLVPNACTVLTGPRYALLRSEFAKLRDYSLRRRMVSQFKHLLIAMGGVDEPNATSRVLEALKDCPLPDDCRISVVMGRHALWLNQVRLLAQQMPWATEILVNVRNMAKLMADADLAIGAAGGTAWERCCMGLPSLIVVLAPNQRAGAAALAATGSTVSLGGVGEVRRTLSPAMQWVLQAGRLPAMSEASRTLADGEGASRVTSTILERKKLN
jgi:UDP-2,4-diacetamido-2,4,6-trideoxy-beta-L-altropyranose hydrolase